MKRAQKNMAPLPWDLGETLEVEALEEVDKVIMDLSTDDVDPEPAQEKKKRKQEPGSLAFTWTDNTLSEQKKLRPTETYKIFVKQVAPSTGKEHYQGYTQVAGLTRVTDMRKRMPGCHVEVSRGDCKKNQTYIMYGRPGEPCTNVECVQEIGTAQDVEIAHERPGQGARTDLIGLREAAKKGWTWYETANNDGLVSTLARHEKFFERYKSEHEYHQLKEIAWPIKYRWFDIPKPDPAVKKRHWYVIGPSSLGKSFHLMNATMDMKVFWAESKRMDTALESYRDQELLVFDDNKIDMHMVIDISNTHKYMKKRSAGDRNFDRYWKKNQTRTMVILSYLPLPNELGKDESFQERFNVLHVTEPLELPSEWT